MPDRARAALALSAALLCSAVQAKTIAGVQLSEHATLGGRRLELASCGVRDTLWIDHYVAALYLPPGAAAAQAMRDPRQPKLIRLHIVGTALLPERIPERWRQVLREELRRDPLARVREAYGALAAGDRVAIAYRPGDGVTLSVNAGAVAHAPGHHVLDAMLRAWAEGDPISGKLQRLLLEHPC